MRLLLVLFLALPSFSQVLPSSQWSIPNGQWNFANNDLDCIQTANVNVVGPFLNLNVKAQTIFCPGGPFYAGQTQNYTTGTIIAKTFHFLYGKVVVRAKMPGFGVHGGVYMADARCQTVITTGGGFGSAAACPFATEVDILDYVPALSAGVSGGYCGYFTTAGTTVIYQAMSLSGYDARDWHVYSLAWTPSSLTWQIDGSTVCTSSSPGVALLPILSTEVNASNSGTPPNSSYPLTVLIDYERICSDSTVACNVGDPTLIFEDEFSGNDSAVAGSGAVRGKSTAR